MRWTRSGGSPAPSGRSLMGVCSGGIVASMTAAHLAATGEQDRLAGFALVVTVLDQPGPGLPAALADRRLAAAATALARRRATSTAAPWPRCSPGCAPAT